MNCSRTSFSKSFDRNGRFQIGLQFFSSLGSSDGLLKRGLTTALLKSEGMVPEASDSLRMFVIVGRRTSRFLFSSLVGMGSSTEALRTFWRIILLTSSSETGGKEQEWGAREYRLAIKNCLCHKQNAVSDRENFVFEKKKSH